MREVHRLHAAFQAESGKHALTRAHEKGEVKGLGG